MDTDRLYKILENFADEGRLSDLEIILAETQNDSSVEWSDVRNNISICTWGKCIEHELLILDSERKYNLQNRADIATYITEERDERQENVFNKDYEASDLKLIDKLIAVVSIGFFVGFTIDSVRFHVYESLNTLFYPLVEYTNIFFTLIFLSVLTSIWSRIIRQFIDSKSVRYYNKDIKNIHEDANIYRIPKDLNQRTRGKIEEIQTVMLKDQIKPVIWILCITIPILLWLSTEIMIVSTYPPISIPYIGEMYLSQSILGPINLWLFIYILVSLITSPILVRISNYL